MLSLLNRPMKHESISLYAASLSTHSMEELGHDKEEDSALEDSTVFCLLGFGAPSNNVSSGG